MEKITTIGLDIAKHVFQVRGIDASGNVGIGPITASAIAATITDVRLFSSGRHLAAWIGLVPRQNSSGGKERLAYETPAAFAAKLAATGCHATPLRGSACQPFAQPAPQGIQQARSLKAAG